ncbi:MAG: response regulator [Verrucomicrobia bacterium]|nr:response regulator [Cytophagales bacterium]
MDLSKYKTKYLQQKCQFLLFDRQGTILESCETIFATRNIPSDNVFISFPILESLQIELEEIIPGDPPLILRCVEMTEFGNPGIYDFEISRQPETGHLLWIITNGTDHYQYLRLLQHERNESLISKEYTELRNRMIQAEKELLHFKNTELERLYKFKNDFFSYISHEIRTPAHGIAGIAQMLKTIADDEKKKHCLQTIITSANHLTDIVNDLLDHAKLEAGKMTFEKQPFCLPEVAQSVRDLFTFVMAEKNLDFYLFIDEKVSENLLGDERKLSQILYNLIGNAVKFTHEGNISLKISPKNLSETACTLLFEVSDTGIGMSEAQVSKLFQPYFQTEDTLRIYGGTGLGLAIIKQIIELQQGTISVATQLHLGTTFTFELLFERPHLLHKNRVLTEQLPENLRILLVDDEQMNQLVASHLLSQLKAKVTIAQDGLEALENIRDNSYDMVLMDLNMPKLNGWQAIQEIRKTYTSEQLPVIALTAADTEIKKCLQMGMNNHLPKPFTLETLREKMLEIFGK